MDSIGEDVSGVKVEREPRRQIMADLKRETFSLHLSQCSALAHFFDGSNEREGGNDDNTLSESVDPQDASVVDQTMVTSIPETQEPENPEYPPSPKHDQTLKEM